MKSIFELDEEALKYLSQQISTDWVIEYFKIHPKEFSKIKPGFRSQSLSSSEAKKILLESLLNKGGISKAVEKNVEKWINATKEALQKSQDDGLTIDESHASQPLPSFDKHPQLSGQVSFLQHRTTLLQNRWKCHSEGDFR